MGHAATDGLRAATRDIHTRLHGNPAFAPLAATPPDAPGYIRLLRRLHGYHVPAEAWLFGAASRLLPQLDDLAERRKAHLLGCDLAALGRAANPTGGVAAMPQRESIPAVLGGLYVVEGATLGGRELGRALAPTLAGLGLAGDDGRRFFLAYGPRQGAMWRRFCGVLETAAARFTPAEQQTMEATARDMFLILEAWLARDVTTA
jgi:heme oxygenase